MTNIMNIIKWRLTAIGVKAVDIITHTRKKAEIHHSTCSDAKASARPRSPKKHKRTGVKRVEKRESSSILGCVSVCWCWRCIFFHAPAADSRTHLPDRMAAQPNGT